MQREREREMFEHFMISLITRTYTKCIQILQPLSIGGNILLYIFRRRHVVGGIKTRQASSASSIIIFDNQAKDFFESNFPRYQTETQKTKQTHAPKTAQGPTKAKPSKVSAFTSVSVP